LALHRSGYPDVTTLRNVIKRGNPNFGTSAVGAGQDTEGSQWIISVVDRADSRPVNVSIWGGSTDLAQALWRVRNDRTSSQLSAFLSKLRVHAIGDQDNTGPWIRQQFPSLWYILDLYPADKYQSPYRGMYLGGDTSIRSGTWVQTHVRTNHGPLGALYPASAPGSDGVKEGDTPSWFYFLPNGLQSADRPGWGGWGGRFSGAGPQFASDALDTVGSETSRRATVWRWRPHFQNEFQARMDWCVKPFSGANHPPVAAVAGGTSKSAAPGQTVVLDASGSSDPDGHARTYRWWVYREAGTYTGTVALSNSTASIASFTAPSVSSARTIHVVLEVRDAGTPALTSYRRVVVTVSPGATANQPPVVSVTQPNSDGQTFAPGATLSFAGTASDPEGGTLVREWFIDRIGDGLAAARLSATGTSGTQVLSGAIGSVQLGVDNTDYDLVLRATDPQGLASEAKRRYRVQSSTTTPFSVTVKSVSTGRPYSLSTANAGALYYIDRSYTIGSLSSALANQTLVRTSNDDKNVSSSAHLTVTLSGAATVYVGYDRRAAKAPSWLSGWTLTSESMAVSDAPASPLRVYSKAFAAGDVVLGGNQTGGPTGAESHYVVIVKGSATSAARALPDDVWEHPGDADGDGLMDAFEAAHGTEAVSADSDGDGTPDEGELDALGRTLWDVQESSSAPAGDGGSGGGNCGLLGLEALALIGFLFRRRTQSATGGR
ncbi:MAG TPA: nucleoside hydrolase-like domain-containing protein, partial [Planctomycetota bacterium]|nr:nucleoside hydrolase-like domain-containing protein [Planctomycetota bacterium]